MAIYRICTDDAHYLNFVISGSEVEEKLGWDHPFHIDTRPKPYAHLWHEPLKMTFYYGNYTKGKAVPDIAENGGRLYFSEQAHNALHKLLETSGEFLPVIHEGGTGYIFNPLKTAEDVEGVAEIFHDVHDNLEGFRFDEERVKDLSIFKTEVDNYLGIFCNEAFKNSVENAEYKGVRFTLHYSDLFRISRGLFD